ncbi:MarR family transcriptional regulator [Bacillus mangrovi]|uniref:MarR family transcriptional regulator n=1 Tax=Metabacillus mangrovi TaxID=1491830 RepID=A0A7X2S1V1_9BACI|nr:MarR family transcriptional regulator [Metabacillus mangrovi]MTH51892.1 MarR family transcriptional regulator [Metabacillus mangrovi]
METKRELFQIMVRRLGLLDKNCCTAADADLTLVQSHILAELERREAPSIQDVADTLGTDITTFSRQIQTMVKSGMITKKQSANDKRVYHLFLTEKGKNVSESINDQMNNFLEDVFSFMKPEEKEQVLTSIKLLNDSMAKSSMCCRPIRS